MFPSLSPTVIAVRKISIAVALLALAACKSDKKTSTAVQTAAVTRRDIVIDAQATGVIEPITIVEVKSKAGGMITKMPVETGTLVKPGDLIVQIETRDVQNQFNQTNAALAAAKSKLDVSTAQKKRSDQLFKDRIITATEHEAAQLDYANAQSQLVAANTNMDLAKQRLEDATVTAPVAGTIIERTVALGTVITSATGSVGGGTTIVKMADLGRVRVRALFNETDIGQVRPGETATVTVDAYPDRRFVGQVEKIEPQAIVQQNVTMFPVLVELDNSEGLLKPGMNGETSVLVDQRSGVLAVPNDAIRNTREAAATAPLLGLNADTVRAMVATQQQAMRGNRGGGGPGAPGAAPGARGAAAPAGAATTSKGDVALDLQGGQGGGGGGRGFQMPDVSDKDCAMIAAAFKKKPAEQKKLDDLRAQMMSQAITRDQMREQSTAIYAAVGVDGQKAGACRRKEMMANGGGRGGFGGGQGGAPGAGGAASAGGARQFSQGGQAGGARGGGNAGGRTGGASGLNIGGGEMGGGGATRRPRSGLVFVKKGDTFEPRVVQLGAANFDYTEITSGVKEGEQVALLASALLQAQRQQQNDRNRANAGVPGMTQGGGAGGAAGGRPAGGGGGGGGGGGRGGL